MKGLVFTFLRARRFDVVIFFVAPSANFLFRIGERQQTKNQFKWVQIKMSQRKFHNTAFGKYLLDAIS
jgi:hypothetical protein